MDPEPRYGLMERRSKALREQVAIWTGGYVGGALTVILAVGAIVALSALFRPKYKKFPDIAQVQAGFVAPSKLEITVEDLDKNGESETVARIDGNPFLLMYGSDGKPQLRPYEVKPAEIVPK